MVKFSGMVGFSLTMVWIRFVVYRSMYRSMNRSRSVVGFRGMVGSGGMVGCGFVVGYGVIVGLARISYFSHITPIFSINVVSNRL